MATLQQVVQLVFEGVDNASQTADSVTKSIGDLANKGKDLTQPLADATTGVLKFEAGLLAAGAALGIVAVNEADKFDLAFREIATLTNETVDNLSGFRQAILDYASTSTQSIDQVTGAIYTAISAGIDYKNSIEFVAASERLAVAGKAELTDTVIVLSGTLNAYGESSDQAAKYADILFNTVKQGQTTLPELSAALSGGNGHGCLGGVAFEEVAAALATLTASGAPTGAAVTRLNALLSAIIKPSSEAAKLAEELGLSWNSQTLKAKGLNGILADMAAKTGGAADKVAILTGGTEALSAANVLGISNSSKFNENLAQMQKSSGAVETAFNKMKDATDTLGQAFTVALISLGDPFLDEFNRIEDALASLATSFSTAIKSETFKPLLDVVENNLGKIGELIENIANNLPAAINGVDLKPFANSLNDLFKGISDLFNFDALSSEQGLTKAIQTVINLLTQTTTYSTGALNSLGPFVSKLGDAAVAISSIDIDKITKLGEIGGYALAANVGLGFLGGAMLAVNGALAIAGPAISAVGTASSALATGLSGAGGLIAAMGPAGLAAAALAAVASYTVLETSKRNQIALTKELKDNIGPLVDKIEKESEAAKEVRLRIDGILDARAEEARKTDGVSESLDRLTKYWKEQGYAYDTATGAITKLNAEQGKFFDDLKFKDINNVTLDTYIDKTGQLVTTFDQIGGGTVKATGAFAAVKDKTEEAKDALDKLIESGKLTTDQFIEVTKNANDFKAKMEEISSNERIKNIEAYVNLNVADLEAQAKIVEATFASIDNTVSSTGDLLGSLFGDLANADTYSRLKIESQIDLENKRRDAALELQKKLTEAEIENIRAKTRQIEKGDALITVEAAGLEPHLEAIWFQIMKYIRVRVNSDAEQFLLGST